ncbi:MAG TPA: GNAT family N-acetyltransferase [Ktedonobacterales bacterium]|jgi:RimJ/RimL family protein N-acetyltransferase
MNPARKLLPVADHLTTARVVIRAYRPADAEALYESVAASREHIARWLPWAHEHTGADYARDLIARFQQQWRLGEDYTYGVFARTANDQPVDLPANQSATPSGALLGGLGLHPRHWDVPSFEMGYWLAAHAEGHGYITEAASALVAYTLREMGALRIEIRCDARNARSAAVAQRLGFAQEALLHKHRRAADGSLRDTLIFAKVV